MAALPRQRKHGEPTVLTQSEKQVSLSGVRSHGLMPLTPGFEKPRQGRVHHRDDWLPLQRGGMVFLT